MSGTATPTIQPDSFLTLHYRLAGANGDVINTFGGKPATLQMGSGSLAAPLEEKLIGLHEGHREAFELPAGSVFGEADPGKRQWLSHSALKEFGDPEAQYHVGEVLQFPTPDGEARLAATVVQLGEKAVLLDFNHPLSDQALVFEVEVIGIL
ncbi:MAG: FKBP-type peptidyl-prolyl cis-trans isomerase [Brachymonas sp.]|nr:FKBP-type peptidyl-prolyl cis-trans isomerase [Brachymonas sp.]